jgi:hypothetical protein
VAAWQTFGYPTDPTTGGTEAERSKRYLILDWDDALMILFYNTAENDMPRAWHGGLIGQARYTDDIDGNGGVTDIRMDGLGVIGYTPNDRDNGQEPWASTSSLSKECGFRLALGNTADHNSLGASWLITCYMPHSPSTQSDYEISPDLVRRVSPAHFCHPVYSSAVTSVPDGAVISEAKYLKFARPAYPFTKKAVGGVEYLLHIHDDASEQGAQCVHIPDGVALTTDGVYVP